MEGLLLCVAWMVVAEELVMLGLVERADKLFWEVILVLIGLLLV